MSGQFGQSRNDPLCSDRAATGAAAGAVTKLADDQAMTTLELKTSYLKAMTANTGKVRAEGRVISIGRRVAYVEATLTDEAGVLHATATSTLLVIQQ